VGCLISPKDYPLGDLDDAGSGGDPSGTMSGESSGGKSGTAAGGKGGSAAGGSANTSDAGEQTGGTRAVAGANPLGGMGGGGSGAIGGGGGTGGATQKLTLTFGERPTSQTQGVTFDTEITGAAGLEGHNYGTNIHIGVDADPIKYGLLRFDITAIPDSAVVLNAKLSLWTSDCNGCQANPASMVNLYPLLEEWAEGDLFDVPGACNWLDRKNGVSWSAPGAAPHSRSNMTIGAFSPTSLSTEYVLDLPQPLVQSWVTTPAKNFGLLFLIVASDGDGIALIASEHTNQASRPQLTVEYQQ